MKSKSDTKRSVVAPSVIARIKAMTREDRSRLLDELERPTPEEIEDLKRWKKAGCPPTVFPTVAEDGDGFMNALRLERLRRFALGVPSDIDRVITEANREGREQRYWAGDLAAHRTTAQELRTQLDRTIRAVEVVHREVSVLAKLEERRPVNEPSSTMAMAAALGIQALSPRTSREAVSLDLFMAQSRSLLAVLRSLHTSTRRAPNAPEADPRIRAVEALCRSKGINRPADIARVLIHEGLESPPAGLSGGHAIRAVAERVRARLKRRTRRGR